MVWTGGTVETLQTTLDNIQAIIEYLPGEYTSHFISLLRDYIVCAELALFSERRNPLMPHFQCPPYLVQLLQQNRIQHQPFEGVPPWEHTVSEPQEELQDRSQWEHLMDR